MPFVYPEYDIEWPEDADDDYEPPPPGISDFEYIPPPEFGGVREPARFTIGSAESEGGRPSLIGRLIEWSSGVCGARYSRQGAPDTQRSEDRRRQQLLDIIVPALRAIGGNDLCCAYDGGNDEGFAWFESLRTADGVLSLDEVIERIDRPELIETLRAAALIGDADEIGGDDTAQLKELVDDWLPGDLGCLLLGDGFGTGEYSMYGAFEADLVGCMIRDDPRARFPANANTLVKGEND